MNKFTHISVSVGYFIYKLIKVCLWDRSYRSIRITRSPFLTNPPYLIDLMVRQNLIVSHSSKRMSNKQCSIEFCLTLSEGYGTMGNRWICGFNPSEPNRHLIYTVLSQPDLLTFSSLFEILELYQVKRSSGWQR